MAQLDFRIHALRISTIDYDYIMKLIADFSTKKPGKSTMSREQLVSLIAGDAKFIDERDLITEYVRASPLVKVFLNRHRTGLKQFKAVQAAREAKRYRHPPRLGRHSAAKLCGCRAGAPHLRRRATYRTARSAGAGLEGPHTERAGLDG
ncbi:MAG: hypothetical protein IPO19_13290, partial [Rhodoferax sp.]|nr:hypothetical protein [Rhodoferax sp.]